jgi:hypothetical protein
VRRLLWPLAVAVWVSVVATGFGVVWRYAAHPGAPSQAPARWPSESRLRRADAATLLMFVHPRCVCSRASLADLGRLLARVQVNATVVFVHPAGLPRQDGDLRQIAARLPATLVDDDGGVESRRFGATTSGATLLFDAHGRLLFAGGLTDVRGHEGNSFGEERMVALLTGREADRRDTPVFGCALEDPQEKNAHE